MRPKVPFGLKSFATCLVARGLEGAVKGKPVQCGERAVKMRKKTLINAEKANDFKLKFIHLFKKNYTPCNDE